MKNPSYEYRAIYFDADDGKPKVIWPESPTEDSPETMAFRLDHYVESGYATGGHLESFIEGIGWVLLD